eukprot:CAMPEP_0115045614 /NCGR_PEP_ID=MMETSP0216-20121206/48249_1 /TAXON_ID=223996 /ORGANISM="Protocruzia adherens, Strain Boccale" /LENGTH=194 /DNA_ID=CAMNT_0002428519 /DNA_START=391 /DNA_END=972 /DNA_ORIENTATION=-
MERNNENYNQYFPEWSREVIRTLLEKYNFDIENKTMSQLKREVKRALEEHQGYPHITTRKLLGEGRGYFRAYVLSDNVWTLALRKRVFPESQSDICPCNNTPENLQHTINECTRDPQMTPRRQKLVQSIQCCKRFTEEEIKADIYLHHSNQDHQDGTKHIQENHENNNISRRHGRTTPPTRYGRKVKNTTTLLS